MLAAGAAPTLPPSRGSLSYPGPGRSPCSQAVVPLRGAAAWTFPNPPGHRPPEVLADPPLDRVPPGPLERQAYEGMGRYAEAIRLVKEFEPWAEAGPQGFNWRARWMPHAVMAGDTTGAWAMVDSLRTATVELQADRVNPRARALYTGAQILSVLGRRGEAVGMLVQALSNGYRLDFDEELMWYWAPIRDYPQFQALMRPKR